MSDREQWQENNNRRLASALAELRRRLVQYIERQSGEESLTPPAIPEGKPVSRSFFQRLLREQATAEAEPKPVPLAADSALESQESEPLPEESPQLAESDSALDLLPGLLGLSVFEKDVLLLCAAMELDTRIAQLCARAHDDPQKPFPTFALAMALFDEPSWDALSPERPLRFWRLLDIYQPDAQPLTASALRADERIVNYLKGLNYLDDRLSLFCSPLEACDGEADLAESQLLVVEAVTKRLRHAAAIGPIPVLQLAGPDSESKHIAARAVAARFGRHLYQLPADLLPTAPADLESLARLWQRENILMPLALYLDAHEIDGGSAERSGSLRRFLSRSFGLLFLGVREVLSRLGRPSMAIDIAKPTSIEQEAAWISETEKITPEWGARLATQFSLNLPVIHQLGRLATVEAENTTDAVGEKAWELACISERPRLDALAQRLELKMTWSDLVLPRSEKDLLTQIAAQVGQRNRVYGKWGFARKMNRGFGISALFAGDSGTGKTMAAEIIANDLRLNLYRIDLSAVVNKYIGETEKNLRRLFDAAEEGGAILFFDEADALFGKRSEVKDSHDRYANIEINYLLQRIESYRGLAILATNMKSALDTAFLRRLRFVVNFPFPGIADRRRLWEKVFLQDDVALGLSTPPLEDLDYDRLARLNLSGGHIHNVALNAAFIAAEREKAVSMPIILEAARAECVKLERPINEADFRWSDTAGPASKSYRRENSVTA